MALVTLSFKSCHATIVLSGRSSLERLVTHSEVGGRYCFDRFYATQLGGKAVDMLLEGQGNAVATLQWNHEGGFHVASTSSQAFCDRWGVIHARRLHPSFYDEERMRISRTGCEYLMPIFTNAIGHDDLEYIRETYFDSGNLFRRYHSVNSDIAKRTMFL